MMATKSYIISISFILLFLSDYLIAQLPQPEPNNEWYKIYNRGISDDGLWSFYRKTFDNGKIKNILQNTATKKEELSLFDIGKYFLNNQYFISLSDKDLLLVKDLNNGDENIYENTTDFEYDPDLNTILIIQETSLEWINLNNHNHKSFRDFNEIQKIPGTPCTLVSGSNKVGLLNREIGSLTTIAEGNITQSFAILNTEKKNIKVLLNKNDQYQINTVDYFGNDIESQTIIDNGSNFSFLAFLNENTLIASEPLSKKTDTDTLEVWSNNDKALKPNLMRRYEEARVLELINLENPETNRKSYVNFDTKHYLIFEDEYILEVSELENYDFETNNMIAQPKIQLRNRRTNKMVMDQEKVQAVYPSLKERYIIYFQGKDWFIYEVTSNKTINITRTIPDNFYQYERLNTISHPVDTPRFSSDYQYIYLTSKNDIWRYSFRKNEMLRLTHHHDSKISFRIKEDHGGYGVQRMKWNNNPILQYDYLLLRMVNEYDQLHEGLAYWKDSILTIIEKPEIQTIDQIQQSKFAISYATQNANRPPVLSVYHFSTGYKKKFHDTAKIGYKANFPITELRSWVNSKGQRSYVTIVLPSDYSPHKKYPSIVRIYENEAKRYKEFVYPTHHNTTGFNRILMAKEGYIVILPQITYIKNKVGNAALKSVKETVGKVKSWYSLDQKNIGIIGHSFGGYETNYILTKSSLFKTAVSGSGIADIVSDYFTVHKMYRNSNISRYTNEQFGFINDFFTLKKAYLANNPILSADRIITPLLLWSGKEDEHVEWRQSTHLFMALSSLKKEVHMILVPNDVHVLVKPKNQIATTKYILEWFNYYLKNGQKPMWF